MKVNLIERFRNHDDFIGWFILHAVTKKDGAINEITQNHKYGEYHDIVFTINGVELPFVETMEDFKSDFDNLVLSKAQDLVQARLDHQMGEAEEVVQDLIEQMKAILTKAKKLNDESPDSD